MRRIGIAAFVILAGWVLTAVTTCSAQTDPNDDLKSHWQTDSQHEFRKAVRSGIGFSFVYDGQPIGPSLPKDWRVEGDAAGRETTFRHPSGLTAVRRVRVFPQFGALEYAVRFKNDGATELPSLSDIQAVNLTFERSAQAEDSIVTCGGGGADANFPPEDFAVARTVLASPQDSLSLMADGGKPSAVQLPFFFVQNQARNAGLFVGIGWTGQWQATVRADRSRHTLSIQAGIPGLDIRLRPGEEISGPTVLLGGYCGPLSHGTTVLRRLIRDCYAPTINGQSVSAPVLYTTWFDIGAELDEKLASTLIDRAAEIGQEVFLFDAGWYRGTPRRSTRTCGRRGKPSASRSATGSRARNPAAFPGGSSHWLNGYEHAG